MLYTLVRKTVTEGEFAKSETFTDYDKCLKAFYQYLSNNVADESVRRFDITILNGDLIPCKTEHFVREVEEVITEEVTEEVTE